LCVSGIEKTTTQRIDAMRNLKLSILLFSLIFGAVIVDLHAVTYSLSDCQTLALSNNEEIKTLEESVKKADAQVSEAWGSALPSISLQGKYEYALEQYSPFTSGGDQNANPFQTSGPFLDPNSPSYDPATAALVQDLGAMLDFSGLVYDYNTSLSLVVSQIIFAQGKVSTGLRIAETWKRNLTLEKQRISSDLKKTVTSQFYQAIYAKQALDVYYSAIETAEKHLKQVETMAAAGLVSDLDLLRAQLQVEDLKSNRDQMDKNLLLAKNNLLRTMGLSWDPEVELQGELADPGNMDLENLQQRALEKRAELEQLDEVKKIQEFLVDIEQADYLPLIYAGASISKIAAHNDPVPSDFYDDQRIFLGMEWNLFKGGQTRQKVIQAKTEVRKIEIQKSQAKNAIAIQVEAAANNLNESRVRLDVKQRRIELAEKVLNIATVSYESGNATQLEVLDANLDLRRSRLEYLQALLDVNVSTLNLKNALGEL